MNHMSAEQKALLQDLSRRTGLEFPVHRTAQILRTLSLAMEEAGFAHLGEFRAAVLADTRLFDDLVGQLTIGETYFFRDTQQFQWIRTTLLPELHQQRRRPLRFWSAGCSSGEEAYSLAILNDRLGTPGLVLATDISRSALQRARSGAYRDWSLRGDWSDLVRPYLTWDGELWQLDARIRAQVQFQYLNLATDRYPAAETDTCDQDLILCRNVLIYLDRNTVRRVVQALVSCLRPGGWLMLGASDPEASQFADVQSVTTPAGILYRRAGGEPRPADQQAITAVHLSVRSAASQDADTAATLSEPVISDTDQLQHQQPLKAVGSDHGSDAGSTVETESGGAATAEHRRTAAGQALQRGEYQRTVDLTAGDDSDAATWVLKIRALANIDPERAEQSCQEAVRRHPLSAELQFLWAALQLHRNRNLEAAQILRRVVYLDPSLAIAHFTLGTVESLLGNRQAASRAFRNARRLCAAMDADAVLPLSDDERAGHLSRAAERQLQQLTPEPASQDESSAAD